MIPKKNNQFSRNLKAFTIIEMLIVVAIIAILAAILIIAINPSRQLAQARNAQRNSDLRALQSATNQFFIDNLVWPIGLDENNKEICDENGEPAEECLNLKKYLVPTYISAIPIDPLVSIGTGYYIALKDNNSTYLTSPNFDKESNFVSVQVNNAYFRLSRLSIIILLAVVAIIILIILSILMKIDSLRDA